MSRTWIPWLLGAGVAVLAAGIGAFFALRINREQEPPTANSAAVSTAHVQMVSLPGGAFHMGNDEVESQKPVHSVTVKPFAMDRTEVTVDAYARCVAAGACSPAGNKHADCNAKRNASGDEPINCVTFPQAEAYCKWRHARLPTEEEWEYAARGKEGRAHPWGDGHPKGRACYLRKPSGQRTCSVASHPVDKTPEGIFDLGGNVAEWTSSAYCNYDGSDCKPGHRVTRGGSWDMFNPAFVRSSFRDFVADAVWGYNLGFRCVKDP